MKHITLAVLVFISVFALLGVASATDVSTGNGSINSSLNSSNVTVNQSSILNTSNSTNYRKGEIFVRFNSSNANLKEISKKANLQVGATVVEEFSEVKGLQLVKIPENISLQDALAKYLANPYVLYAEPNYLYQEETIPNDKYYGDQWGLSQINASMAWNITTGSGKVIIAIIDSGIDLNNPDLKAHIWINPGEIPGNGIDDDHDGYIDDVYGWNFVDNNNNVTDDDGHGTHVAGIITAIGNNTIGVTGVMWNATIIPIKFLDRNGEGYIDDAVSAVRYATKKGANIINCSWGGSEYSKALKDVIDASSALVVCAAGNEDGANDDVSPVYPASFTSPNIISVAATDQNDALASFSDYGVNSVDVAAPGTGILSTLPGSKYGYMSGTSMATPYVSGLAGLIKSIRPDLTALQIKYTILNNVDRIDSLAGKILTGGRIDAYKALTNIITDSTAPTVSANLKGGSYYSIPLYVNLTASEPATIYYTLNGTDPTIDSLLYNGSIILNATQTIKFIAIDTSGTLSGVYTEKYNIYKMVPYSYKAKVPYKKVRYKKWYKKWYKKSYWRHGKRHYYWTYKWKYTWAYKWYYRYETRYGKKPVLI